MSPYGRQSSAHNELNSDHKETISAGRYLWESSRQTGERALDLIDDLFSNVDELPALPEVHTRLLELMADDEATSRGVARVIEQDPVISARILRIANCPLFVRAGRSSSVCEAVVRLGLSEVRNIVYTCAVAKVLPTRPSEAVVRAFWRVAVGSAISARRLAHDLQYAFPDRAYLGALVHCIGEISLAIYFPDRLEDAIDHSRREQCGLPEAIYSEFKFTAPELSARILQRWRFADAISEAVQFQLDPDEAPNEAVLASVVFASSQICRGLGLGVEEQPRGENWSTRIAPLFAERLSQDGHSDLVTYLSVHEGLMQETSSLIELLF